MILSIIIPIFNSEDTIEETVKSILNCNISNIEVILVDDGSIDGSSKICDSLAIRDSRCSVIHKENGGVSSARNVGIRYAQGDYIYFCDSDDKVNKSILAEAIMLLERVKSDVFIFDFCYFEYTGEKTKRSFIMPENQIIPKEQIIQYIIKPLVLKQSTDLAPLWHKFFKRERIKKNNIYFNEKVFKGEDWQFVLNYLSVAETAYYYPKEIYFYILDGTQCESKYKKIPGIHLLESAKMKILLNEKYELGADDDALLLWYDSQINALIFSAKNKISSDEWKKMLDDWSVIKAANMLCALKKADYFRLEISRKHYIYAWLIKFRMKDLLFLLIKRLED